MGVMCSPKQVSAVSCRSMPLYGKHVRVCIEYTVVRKSEISVVNIFPQLARILKMPTSYV